MEPIFIAISFVLSLVIMFVVATKTNSGLLGFFAMILAGAYLAAAFIMSSTGLFGVSLAVSFTVWALYLVKGNISQALYGLIILAFELGNLAVLAFTPAEQWAVTLFAAFGGVRFCLALGMIFWQSIMDKKD
jgi:hypothetical protein